MKSYLEIQVPIQKDDHWFEDLRSALSGIPVRWQDGFYHITMAFLNETPEDVDLRPIFEKHFNGTYAPVLTFDKIDVFSTASKMLIIYLTSMRVPESSREQVEAIRNDLKAAGCRIQSDFMLHVTLGRVRDENVNASTLKQLLDSVTVPPFTLSLTDVNYRVFRGRILYETKLKKCE
jgi:2'-5' RNA ligase